MHNGQFAALRDVVKHYSEVDLNNLHLVHLYDRDGVPQALPADKLLRPLGLSDAEIDDVVAFLETLTDKQAGARFKPVAATSTCR